jgi:hypothetical protein
MCFNPQLLDAVRRVLMEFVIPYIILKITGRGAKSRKKII